MVAALLWPQVYDNVHVKNKNSSIKVYNFSTLPDLRIELLGNQICFNQYFNPLSQISIEQPSCAIFKP